jgi:hypothetical protein
LSDAVGRQFGGYCKKVISLANECAKANTLTIVTIVLLELMLKVYGLGESDLDLQLTSQLLEMISGYLGLKEHANRIHRDFGNVGLDFLSAFKDVQLILQNSSDVRVLFHKLTLSGTRFLLQLQMIWRKKTGLAYMGLHVCLRD